MNNRQLKSFLLVAEKGSLSKAADQLFISVQALRQQVGLLEKEVGVSLLERNSKGVILTPVGQYFIEKARQIVELQEVCIDEVRRLALEPTDDQLRIGVFTNPLLLPIPRISSEFSKIYPDVRQVVVPIQNDYLSPFHALDEDAIDVFEFPYIHHCAKWIAFTEIYSSRTVCVLSPAHHLADQQTIGIADLCGETVLIHNRKLHPTLLKYIDEADIDIDIADCSADYHGLEIHDIIRRCLSNSIFLAPEEYSEFFPTLRRIPLDLDISWPFGLYYKKSANQWVRLFVDAAQSVF